MASSSKVQVSESRANSANSKLKKDYDELERKMKAIDNDVQSIISWWTGETSKRFMDVYAKATKEFVKNLKKLEEHGAKMVESVKKQNEADRSIANSLRK